MQHLENLILVRSKQAKQKSVKRETGYLINTSCKMKGIYRKKLLTSLLTNMKNVYSVNELVKSISVLDCTKQALPGTIHQCSKKATFSLYSEEIQEMNENEKIH